jgi:murein DD-endopeptidase MepM/ murein hydrolase activator NlpD
VTAHASFFPKALFTEAFIKANHLGEKGITAWVFHPDMLFGATRNWWGSKGQRPNPHEGIDICLYRDGDNRIVSIDEGIKVPAMYDGAVAKIVPDFLGKSIILEHWFPKDRQGLSLTIYGHTVPAQGLIEGGHVKGGQVIATVAPPKSTKSFAPPHLHLTIAWSSKAISFTTIDWAAINNPETFHLIDPLQILDGIHVLLDNDAASQQ